MSVAIDPSETRRPAAPAPRPSRVNLRVVLLSGAGLLGLAGFTAFAFAALGSLAGPQFTRPTLATASATPTGLGSNASEWPDLRDGVPALAPSRPKPVAAVPDQPPAAKAELLPAAVSPPAAQVADVRRVQETSMEVKSMDARPVDVKPVDTKPLDAKAAGPKVAEVRAPEAMPVEKPAAASVVAKPVRLPQIENAAVLPPARPASLVPATRTATVIAPLPNETTRSRATNGTFTALAPETPKHSPVAPKAEARTTAAKPAAPKSAADRSTVARVQSAKPAKPETAAAPQVAQAEPEPEQTEFLGVKVPSLAPAGRKIAESVEALGNAVKSLPDHF